MTDMEKFYETMDAWAKERDDAEEARIQRCMKLERAQCGFCLEEHESADGHDALCDECRRIINGEE